MSIHIYSSPAALGKAAGELGARLIKEAIIKNGTATIILATGTSQFETLNHLISDPGIDWNKVCLFHLDEYIGLPISHPASFRKYLKERFISKVPNLKSINLIDGEGDPEAECDRLSTLILEAQIAVAFVGIGENGHLAFNDPPADFETEKPYIVVDLDHACRMQQFGEGWFSSLEVVPKKAISMSIKQILKSKTIVCSVPDLRKAQAVKDCLENPVSNLFPATALRLHPACTYFLDSQSASLLSSSHE